MTTSYHLVAETIDLSCQEKDISIQCSDSFSLCALQITPENSAAAGEAFEKKFNLALPVPGHSVCGVTAGVMITALGLGAGQWFIEKSGAADDYFDDALEAISGSGAAITLQSDAFIRFEVSGAKTGALFERLVALNLSLSAFPPGSCARTSLHQMNCLISHLPSAARRYHLYCARSYAQSFFDALRGAIAGSALC